MRIFRIIGAFLAAVVMTHILASIFYTQQILAKQAAIGAVYSLSQTLETYVMNLAGLAPAYGVVLGVALALGFIIAAIVKRVIKPLAPVAYPIAGAAAVYAAIYLIESLMAAGGAGAIGGARDALGLSLQCLAGAIGGFVFSVLRGGARAA